MSCRTHTQRVPQGTILDEFLVSPNVPLSTQHGLAFDPGSEVAYCS